MTGRKEEQRLLNDLSESGKAELIVIYGRRRIGKTFLVRETFENKFFFTYTGVANINAKQQIKEFVKTLRDHGWDQGDEDAPGNWFDAFHALRKLIKNVNSDERIIIFIDEMPWMDNKKSDFVPAFEHFWNGWASGKSNIMLIICGSAASWITKKIFRSKGGLYNRTTRQIALKPFTLKECKEYYDSKGILMNTQDIIESYMIFGGIPYYLQLINKRYSLSVNVDQICFSEDAPLRYEFKRLMDTLFTDSSKYIEVIETLHAKKKGLTREAIAKQIKFGNGGNLTRILLELEECGFIRKYKSYGSAKNNALYHLTDPFSAFHLTFMRDTIGDTFWSSLTDNAGHRAWSGYAFEQVCFAHISNIKKAIGISAVHSDISSWISRSDETGAQIDLVIDRADRVINLCEIKFANVLYEIDKSYDLNLRNKIETFRKETKTRKALHFTLITTYGVKPGKYTGLIQSEIIMDELLS